MNFLLTEQAFFQHPVGRACVLLGLGKNPQQRTRRVTGREWIHSAARTPEQPGHRPALGSTRGSELGSERGHLQPCAQGKRIPIKLYQCVMSKWVVVIRNDCPLFYF